MRRWVAVAAIATVSGAGLLVALAAWLVESVDRAQRIIDHKEKVTWRKPEPFDGDWDHS